ncbi:MAG: sigma-E processing peptidase SpoIIGA [Clostridia bacterium]|nr:sigma-E processing peptidase SpoIIGA [Clostridia bacterium]
MEVYIEYAFIDNFIIDFILLKLSTKCAKIKTSILRIAVVSIIGSVIAILLPLISVNKIFILPIKITLGLLLSYLSGSFLKFKDYLLSTFYFFAFTFLSGGAIIALFNFASIDYESYFILNYNSFMPIGVTFLIVYLASKCLIILANRLVKSLERENYVRKCVVVINGKKILAQGFIDTGNKLYDNLTGLPVIVASKLFIKKLAFENLLPNSYRNLKIETASGCSTIKIFYIDKLLIYNGINANIYNNVLIGEGLTNLYVDGYTDLLLHYTLK